MIIYINGRFLTQGVSGVQRYSIELLKAIDNLLESELSKEHNYTFEILSPKGVLIKTNFKHIKFRERGYLTGHLWEQLELPFYSRGGMLINLCNAAPMLKRNQIVTIHDAAVFAIPWTYSFLFRSWYQILLKVLGFVSRRILTVSIFSKRELEKYCRIDGAKMLVIYEGKEHITKVESDERILRKYELSDQKYILAVSSMSWNKNFQSVIQAIEILRDINVDVVIVGGTSPKVFKQPDIELSSRVKHVGYVTDGELKALYEQAVCFVYPSFYEGFGLPPIEAMACGCPVIVSSVASLPEVCGNAALYCDPSSPRDIANKISSLLNNLSLRKELVNKGFQRVKAFTWTQCGKDVIAAIEEVLSR
jgi:glycosyltransferase involved in cell wall biosynthesis